MRTSTAPYEQRSVTA